MKEFMIIINQYFVVDTLNQIIQQVDQKASAQEDKYKQKKIRRVCFIDYKPLDDKNSQLVKFQNFFSENKLYSEYKLCFLKEGLDEFQKKYPFLLLNEKDYEEIGEVKQIQNPQDEIEGKKRDILNKNQEKIFYAFSSFPFEIVEGVLYSGNVFHSNSQRYLDDLGIKAMLDFIIHPEDKEKSIPKFKTEKYSYKNIPLDVKVAVDLDFDEINRHIDSQIEALKGPLLVYCANGSSISPAFSIAYLMWKKKMNLQLASMKVFAIQGKVEISPWIYTQLLTYAPKH